METINTEYGYFQITLENVLKQRNISKNKLAYMANLQRTQLNSYCNNKIKRPDFEVLARICYVLKCDIGEIIQYVNPNTTNDLEDWR